MSDAHDLPGDLDEPELELAGRLAAARPVPSARFRGALGRYLLARDPGYGPRPENLRWLVGAAVGGGGALLVVGLVQAAGVL